MSYESENISLVRANTKSFAFDSGVININSALPYSNLFYPFLIDSANNYSNISLTIDILNSFQPDGKYPNENWVKNNRQRNDLLQDQTKWGFKDIL